MYYWQKCAFEVDVTDVSNVVFFCAQILQLFGEIDTKPSAVVLTCHLISQFGNFFVNIKIVHLNEYFGC